jgi:hypothetical protein
MIRKTLLVTLAVLPTALVAGRSADAQGASTLDPEKMKAALRTATPEENGFIDRVLAMVDQRRLPPELVASTFQWARRKARRQFQFFKHGLTVRAARQGIKLDSSGNVVSTTAKSTSPSTLGALLARLFSLGRTR